jgi:hypothetical protein
LEQVALRAPRGDGGNKSGFEQGQGQARSRARAPNKIRPRSLPEASKQDETLPSPIFMNRGAAKRQGGSLVPHQRPPVGGERRPVARMGPGPWSIENRSHSVRDVTMGEDASRVRTGSGPQVYGYGAECDHRVPPPDRRDQHRGGHPPQCLPGRRTLHQVGYLETVKGPAISLTVLVVAAGALAEPAKRLRVQTLKLVDREGKERIVLTAEEGIPDMTSPTNILSDNLGRIRKMGNIDCNPLCPIALGNRKRCFIH